LGDLLNLANLEITNLSYNCENYLVYNYGQALILAKNVLGNIFGDSSLTHLVTLPVIEMQPFVFLAFEKFDAFNAPPNSTY
jgi:hypothetical protein